MEQYLKLLHCKKLLEHKIKVKETKLCRSFFKQNRSVFWYCDILMICALILNFGALAMTNAMVVHKQPDVEFYEASPGTAESYDYVPHPEIAKSNFFNSLYFKFLKLSFSWLVFILLYMWLRIRAFTDYRLWALKIFSAFFFIVLLTDFINDFGFVIGRVMFG